VGVSRGCSYANVSNFDRFLSLCVRAPHLQYQCLGLSTRPPLHPRCRPPRKPNFKSRLPTSTRRVFAPSVAKLVQALPAAENALLAELVTTKPKRKNAERDSEVVSRWEVCSNCREEFDMSKERDEEECLYHSGKGRVLILILRVGYYR
jgi:hypothetical protein